MEVKSKKEVIDFLKKAIDDKERANAQIRKGDKLGDLKGINFVNPIAISNKH